MMRDYKALYPGHACWIFNEFAAKADSSYRKEINGIRKWKNRFQNYIFSEISSKEKDIIEIYNSEPEKALQILTRLSNGFAEKVLSGTKDKLNK